MSGEKIDIKGVPETMLQTLYARAKESRKDPHYIYDEKAIEIVSKMEYDFSLADQDAVMGSGVIARTILLDRMTEDYLNRHPDAVVVNIACGLDTRCWRMQGKFKRWYNMDLPETIEVRRRFLPESGEVSQIAKSAMDDSWAWDIEQKDEPVLVIIEGLTMYLNEQDVKKIFRIIHERFVHATVLVEVMNPWIASHVKEKSIEGSKARFSWGIRNGKEMEQLVPAFHSVEDVSLTEGMRVFMPVYKLLGKIGPVRNVSNKILKLEK